MMRFGAGAFLVLALSSTAFAQVPRSERLQHDAILAEAGGRYSGPQTGYLERVGDRIAAAAGLSGRCEFVLVDSPVVNAFTAPPGCHVYVTRGLLAIMNSEAELAAVLGHELGHVTARHAARQRNQEVVTGIAAVLVGAVTGSDLAGGVAQRAARLSNLGYSRSQEHEADTLSLRYLPQAGYPTAGLASVLAGLQREDEYAARLTGRGPRSTPVWAGTHPLTTDRIRRVIAQAGPDPLGGGDGGLGQEGYLDAVNGLTYGDGSVRGGLVSGRSFTDPRLRIAFQAPPGFRLTDTPGGVRIEGPGGMRGEFATGPTTADGLEDYALQVLGAVAGRAPVQVARSTRGVVNGLEAVTLPARAATRSGPVEVVVTAYAIDGRRACHFVTIAPVGQAGAFEPMYGSLRRLSERESTGRGPARIAVVSVKPGDTVESLGARMAGDDGAGRFRMLNNLAPGEPLVPGRRVKIVTAGRP